MGDPQVWNDRYRRGEHTNAAPSPLFSEVISGLPRGRALDLACGAGRHTLALARLGWEVVAVDGASVAIEMLRGRLSAGEAGRVETIVADLERGQYAPEPGSFDLVCVFHYLHRELFPALRAAVRPGGHAALAIHVAAAASSKLLAPGELRGLFPGWEAIVDREREHQLGAGDRHHHATAELVVRRPWS